jgi:IS5 family transposase
LGDKLVEIDPLVNWELLQPIIREIYDNQTEKGGRQQYRRNCNVKNVDLTSMVWFIRPMDIQKVDTPRGGDGKTRRSKDGEWIKKGNKSYFGYKMHTKMDTNHQLIREIMQHLQIFDSKSRPI